MAADPLEMAGNCVVFIERVAELQECDPVQAYIAHAGEQGRTSAELAGALALVSIARDLRRIADHFDPPPSAEEGHRHGQA
ncbi:MAG TPA: hypothetical protein VGR98_21025 [Streptosporangiaceae bacterium]|nr:hypothetical protein [Streptosporangiaceae bacterium]